MKKVAGPMRAYVTSAATCALAAMCLMFLHGASSLTFGQTSCESLALMSLPHTAIHTAQVVSNGRFAAPASGGRDAQEFTNLPPFCRVSATSRPTNDSNIQIEIWMPVSGWNNKFLVGNVGAGLPAGLRYAPLTTALKNGYATGGISTHRSLRDMADHPEVLVDWAYRGTHELAVTSKALMNAFYGTGPELMLVDECGGGSIPALNEPVHYPEDYDAIAVGGYVSDRTHQVFGQIWPWVAYNRTESSAIPPAKFEVLHNAVLQACDLTDGVQDGIVEPEQCKFDPKVLECKAGDNANCLTSAQVQTVREIYAGPINPRTKRPIYFPYRPGSESGWSQITGAEQGSWSGPQGFRFEADDFFRFLAFKDPNWSYQSRPIDFDKDIALAERPEYLLIDAVRDTPRYDLKKFVDRGGKILLYGGWSDLSLPPGGEIAYYKKVEEKLGAGTARNAVRLFMVPGMGHCPGTSGDENFNVDSLNIVEQWKETGRAPDQVTVSHYKEGVEVGKRLVCPYPQIAMYKGTGSADDPSSFACKAP